MVRGLGDADNTDRKLEGTDAPEYPENPVVLGATAPPAAGAVSPAAYNPEIAEAEPPGVVPEEVVIQAVVPSHEKRKMTINWSSSVLINAGSVNTLNDVNRVNNAIKFTTPEYSLGPPFTCLRHTINQPLESTHSARSIYIIG
eukprot:COSAG05_NODE_3730_length_1876_cov_4.429375_5_plen_142_part_01